MRLPGYILWYIMYIISISKLYQYKNVWTHFLISKVDSFLEFIPGFTAIAWSRFIKTSRACSVSADRMQRVLADLSHQHAATCFYPITFSAHPRSLESATDRPWRRKAKEAQNSPRHEKRCDVARMKGMKPKFRALNPLVNNRDERDWSFYKEIGRPLCYWPCQFCCQFRRQFRCQSRWFLTRIIALRKRFDNFY